MKGIRKLVAFLLSLLLITTVSAAAWATDQPNSGVITPPVWASTQTYDWYTALTAETARSAGQAVTQAYTFAVKANVAKLTVVNNGVRELDVAVDGQRFNLNTFFDKGQGTAEFDISSLIRYGDNTLEVQSLGTPGAKATITVEAPTFTAHVLHTNDLHAAVDTTPKIAAYIKAAKAAGGNTFFVDAGDNFSGNPISDLNAGKPMIEMLNLSSIDVFAVGNHDFDPGPANMQMLRDMSNFAWLSANTEVIDQSATPIQPFEGSKIVTNDLGQKIGFIALTQTPPATGTKNQIGLRFNDPLTVARQLITELRPQVNILVVVSHNGYDWDLANAEALQGADLIIGAHSHTLLTAPTVAAGIPIVQVGSGVTNPKPNANVGDLILTQTDKVVVGPGAAGGKYLVATKDLADVDPDTQAVLTKWHGMMDPILGKKIGYNTSFMTSGGAKATNDIALGNLIADAMRYSMGADVGVWNNGGIRADLPKGDITMNSVYLVLPFGNIPWKVELTGAQMVQFLANSFAKYNKIDLQISGASYTAYTNVDGTLNRIDLKVAGVPVDLNKVYTLSLSDYVATTPVYWNNMTAPLPTDVSSGTDAMAVIDWINHLGGTVSYKSSEGRITTFTPSPPTAVTKLNFYNSSSLLAAGDGGALVPLTNQAIVLVKSESTATHVDRDTTDPKNWTMVDAGTPLPLAAMQSVGTGNVFASGAMLVANGYRTAYQNPQYFTNVLDRLTGTASGIVLFDEGHGQYYGSANMGQIAAFISDRGYTARFTGENTALTAAKLTNVKVLVITTPGSVGAYTADELAVLNDYVMHGGNVILLSQTDYGNNSNPTELNTIAAAIGTAIRFNSDEVRDSKPNIDGSTVYSPITDEFNPDYPDLLKVR